jgi:catechol-2,3-dioxygenase
MNITELRLKTADLSGQRAFYADTLHLPLVEESADTLTIGVGHTRLIFERSEAASRYHLAFNIPENQLEAARLWLKERVSLISLNGKDVFDFASWQAHSAYFYDAAGNVLECIARHRLPNASDRPFDAANLLNISEIGIATADVRATAGKLTGDLGLPVFDGAGSDSFTALGDDNGLFIVVKRGRVWYPESGVPADFAALMVSGTLDGGRQFTLQTDGPDFQIALNSGR